MVKIFFTRHGQTTRNVDGTIQGQNHGDLNSSGKAQIKKLAERLNKSKINHIFSSNSPRCKTTTDEVAKGRNISITYTDLLREKENGEWVGKDSRKVDWDSLEGTFETRKVPNGESLVEVLERGKKFVEDILSKYEDSNATILVVSHGAFLKVLIGHLLGMNIRDSIFKLFIDHCSLTLLEFSKRHPEKCQLKYLNETEFLGDSRNWMEHS